MSILNIMWLQQLLGSVTQNAAKIIDLFGYEKLYASRTDEEFVSLLTKKQQKNLDASAPESFSERFKYCEEHDIHLVPMGSKHYPPQLMALENPPVLLYVRGDVKLLKEGYLVAIVGTRTPSIYGVETTKSLCEALTEYDVTLVSGLAAGLDSVAHRAAIAASTHTIAVLGNGVDYYYPATNRELQIAIEKSGAVVSEFPPKSKPFNGSFIMRNRIIAALSDVLVVTEARERSGTMSTAGFAADIGRTIFAVPGNINSPMASGTNRLIYDGATPIIDPESILYDCGFVTAVKGKAFTLAKMDHLSPLAIKLYESLPNAPVLVEELYDSLEYPIDEILSAFTELELEGLMERLIGGYVLKVTYKGE